MSTFTAEQAIQAGLIDELMSEVIQPLSPKEPIIPTKLSGTYTVDKKRLKVRLHLMNLQSIKII